MTSYNIFAQQRESKFFRNNAIISSEGISANDVGWSSGYVAWGGYMKIKPAKWYYAQAGLFLAIPNANKTANLLDDKFGFYCGTVVRNSLAEAAICEYVTQ